jgi:D-alanine--D-alanine ligase
MRIALTYNEKRSAAEAHAEFDTREAIATLAAIVAGCGHEVVPIDVSGSIPRLVERLQRLTPALVLNLAEGEHGNFREAFYPALFEQLGLAHTGSSASTLALCLDKALAKRVVAAAGVRVPREAQTTPAVVKPNFEGSSKGVTLVPRGGSIPAAVTAARARYPAGVIVEELVEGIDVAVAWFAGLGQLPAIAMRYPGAIYDYALKHETPELVELEIPARLSATTRRRLCTAASRAFAALGVTTYGRADFRVTPDGDAVFLEMNPLPSLTHAKGHDELYLAAARAGWSPAELIDSILRPSEPRRPSRSLPWRRQRASA